MRLFYSIEFLVQRVKVAKAILERKLMSDAPEEGGKVYATDYEESQT